MCWTLGAIGVWVVYDALTTQSTWVKRHTFQWPWYYKVKRADSPFMYWATTISSGIAAVIAFLAPLFLEAR